MLRKWAKGATIDQPTEVNGFGAGEDLQLSHINWILWDDGAALTYIQHLSREQGS